LRNIFRSFITTSAILLYLIIFTSTSPAQLSETGRMVHFRPITASENIDIIIEAEIIDAEEPPQAARIYYRSSEQGSFSISEMSIKTLEINGVIPSDDVVLPLIEYYLEVDFPGGMKITYPVGAPDVNNPITIDIIPNGATIDIGSSAIEIISPEPGIRVNEEDVLIALSLQQHIREMNPDSLLLELNGVDVTRSAFISKEIISFAAKRLRSGIHRIALFELKGERKIHLIGWGFSVVSGDDELRHSRIPFKGNIATNYTHEEISSRKRDILTLASKIRGTSDKVKWAGSIFLTNLEDAELQPQNRFMGMMKVGKFDLKAGDIQPRFSQFTMWGSRNRGVELNLRSSSVNLSFAVGSLLRAIEGTSRTVVDTIYKTNDLGDTTSVEIKTSIITDVPGTYNRMFIAIRPSFPISRYGFLSFNILKVKDYITSINYGLNPKDNLVIGGELELNTRNRRLTFKSETALSLYNSNIASGPMSQAKILEDLIVVNQFFEPLPTDEKILEDNVGNSVLAFTVLKELVKSSMAHETSLGLNYFRNDFRVAFKSVGRSFRSLGSRGVQTDTRGISLSDRIRLFDNRVYVNASYDSYTDNVNGRKPKDETLHRQTMSGGISFYTSENLPNLSFNSRLYGRENSAEIDTVILPDGSEDYTGNPVKDRTLTNSISIDQRFKLGSTEHSAVFAYNTSASDDDYNPNSASDMTTINVGLTSRLLKSFESGFAVSISNQNSFNAANTIEYSRVSANIRYMLLPESLWLSSAINTSFATGGNNEVNIEPTDPDVDRNNVVRSKNIDYRRTQLSFGSEFHLSKQHEFSLNANKVFHDDRGYTLYWSNRKINNKSAATYIKQDDFVTRFKYAYIF